MLEKDEIERWITTDSGAHIPIAKEGSNSDFEDAFVKGLTGISKLEPYLNDGELVKKSDLSDADREKFISSGKYVLNENSFADTISSLENLELKKSFFDAVPEAPKNPSGPVNKSSMALAKKSLDWYDLGHKESLKMAKEYKNEMANFDSKGAKKLLYQKAKWYEKNADESLKNKEWFKRAFSKYL